MTEEQKPKPGAMQIKAGKIKMYLNDKWVDFGVSYVAQDMRRIARPINGRKNGYAPVLHRFADELESKGLSAIKSVQDKLKPFWGASELWMKKDCKVWHSWLNQIWQFRNCTGLKDRPVHANANKNFRENFDKIFLQA